MEEQQARIPEETEAAEMPAPGVAQDVAQRYTSRAKRRLNGLWTEWIRPLMIIALVMFSFRSAVADWNDVPTGSMKPTILEGDRIFINKVAYDLKFPFTTWRLAEWSDPNWGDIVVLRSPEDGKRLVKRVVGLPGDVIEVRGSRLFLNDSPASYLQLEQETIDQIDRDMQAAYFFAAETMEDRTHPIMITIGHPSTPYGPRRLEEGQYFVMGDNRNNSRDSRWFGPVDRSLILGKATAVALSVDPEHHYMPRWQRFFSALP